MVIPSNVTPFPVAAPDEGQLDVWKRESVVRSFNHGSRRAIPLAAQQLDVVYRVLEVHELTVERVLDLGAGDGFAAASIADRYALDHLVLVDFSRPMLDEAKSHFQDAPFPVEFIDADLRDDSWWADVERSGPFDLVISRFAIHHIPDEAKEKLYAQVFRFLRPGGVFINIEHVKSGSPVLHEAFDRLMIEGIVRQSEGEQSRDAIVASYKARQDKDVNILSPVETQLDWLRSSGFADVDCVFKLLELAVLTGRRPS